MKKYVTGWRLSIIGIVIVGLAALIAPNINEGMTYTQTISMFVLFVLFLAGVELLYRRK
ncbi:hypothetical protein XYCOK13_29220 [Xylanibacillus composti]|uniref:Uncharacterized protein n=1 Tax=Xylanibacillus composti TaxID=1572762 RepID=A0A8J4H7Q9_9BACL|nr:hypothetical protein XYCOK13_29220 [Xylanibacillus composti]